MLYPQRLDAATWEIRTITITGQDENDLIACSLDTVRLTEATYTALSYVWGDPTVTKSILVDGHVFQATVNLELALRNLSKDFVGKSLWVDAICINQQDIAEKNQQVPLMGELYGRAAGVVIWLGEADLAVEMLMEGMAQEAPSLQAGVAGTSKRQHEIGIRKRESMFMAIARRPWWKRIWVVQEALLSPEDPIFRCGPHEFTWSRFFAFFLAHYKEAEKLGSTSNERAPEVSEWQERLGIQDSEHYKYGAGSDVITLSVYATVRDDFQRINHVPLSAIVAMGFDRAATVPHDYIYGFLGLMSEHDTTLVDVDYNSSHWDLYRAFAENLVASEDEDGTKVFSTLCFSDGEGRPSWVPDFGRQSMLGPQSGMLLTMDKSWQFPPAVWFSDDNEVLMLAGVLLGDIIWSRHIQASQDGLLSNISGAVDLARRETAAGTPSLTRLFTGNNGGRGPLLKNEAESDRWWDHLMDGAFPIKALLSSEAGQEPRGELDGLSISSVCSQLAASALLTSAGRSLFVTTNSQIGIGVPRCQPGDVVVYLYGMCAPFVLRPEADHYTIIGAARIAGLEDAESLERYCTRHQLAEATFRLG
ncbi:hypothetical protein LTR35_014217 [Friedmanniomyces endolithicus]|uniref:Heterokaryon incompatibility domain-containing protein n=1 Tax=Friedmanniomyces endolithicus TaxID=329885 RepID=A0AAN6FGA1_9PEZI|nr:hypothetical protein LTS00_017022 [Friedmanniomyces endolithicus]KAK0270418.1 hypothetical protein LTR35_014217 [Friedmanniomyces endolithicus]KAK0316981.1 hypothetical protein LTR82_012123 [Friedmanniomyces endolithicus]KAK0973886.1 hypothetical protein LTR54_017246 [Friedmanniomyces endolithicus]